MSKRDYLAIATVILAHRRDAANAEALTALDSVATSLADTFQRNPRFDRDLFLAACGVPRDRSQ
jgi:hypothetical protein